MGRSQVLYNQKHGRPGSSGGRGRGHTHPARQQSQPKPHGDNSWRFQKSGTGIGDAGEVGLDQNSSEIGFLGNSGPMYNEDTPPSQNLDGNLDSEIMKGLLDLRVMGEALSKLSVAGRLRIPPHLTSHLETGAPKVGNASELVNDGEILSSAPRSELGSLQHERDDKEQEAADDPEEDLDAWLETVIS